MARVFQTFATAALALLLWSGAGFAASLTVASPAFKDGDKMPRSAGCEGGDHSPTLSIHGAPAGTKTLAILMTEQDSTKPGTALWMAYNIPGTTATLPENQPRTRQMKGEGLQLQGPGGKMGYSGPCPPTGLTRRYVIEVFALDDALDLPENATKQEFLLAVEGHILAKGKLSGKFKK
ncbi:MAG: phospholipid-binding [Desulfovibrionaceae bacterium]|nr:MAG: phospholipid-binding [Desulfovibrionaceae bacterium]